MVKLYGFTEGVWVADGTRYIENKPENRQELLNTTDNQLPDIQHGRTGTMAYQILTSHNKGTSERLELGFDALASHDITYVGIVQTARAAGLERFPVPYVLTNCHNSLCAVGGTINEDDHAFGLSAAKKYGGIYVPAHAAVIHQYVRETLAAPGRMILGSDSHTRYGFLGTLGFGEGGPELARQLLGLTYSLAPPRVVAVYLAGQPQPGVGPQDVALSIIKTVFKDGVVKNAILEFVGPGIANLSADYRAGIDVMTTETACLSSVWAVDDTIKEYLTMHGRSADYQPVQPAELAYYDGLVHVDLSSVEPMIALPFHPSNAWSIREVNRRPAEFLAEIEAETTKQLGKQQTQLSWQDKIRDGRLVFDQGVVAGCSGGMYENICAATEVLTENQGVTPGFNFSVYPASLPIQLHLMEKGISQELLTAGAVLRSAFCGPCFGAGDVPAHNSLSARHTTRNFPFREGAKPSDGQMAAVALMDARSIAATAANGGKLTPADEVVNGSRKSFAYSFDNSVYAKRVYNGYNQAKPEEELRLGPNIKDWPEISPLPENLLVSLCAVINDSVTTTDELIPSGETSSYRSNPYKLAEYTLSRRCPDYVSRAKAAYQQELERRKAVTSQEGKLPAIITAAYGLVNPAIDEREFANITGVGSVIFACRPGDGSAREQAASSQKVLGGWANIAYDYATKRYRSNVVNWGMLPFTISPDTVPDWSVGMWLYIPGIRQAVASGQSSIAAYVLAEDGSSIHRELQLQLLGMSEEERRILLAGGLIGYLKELAAHK